MLCTGRLKSVSSDRIALVFGGLKNHGRSLLNKLRDFHVFDGTHLETSSRLQMNVAMKMIT